MHSQDPGTGTPGPVTHPDAAEWMAFLYLETAPDRRREMGDHLTQCPTCAARVQAWRAAQHALDDWRLPARRPTSALWFPALKWAAAACLVLGLGFLLGRQSAPRGAELTALQISVSRLADDLRREHNFNLTNNAALAANVAGQATLGLLAEYYRAQHQERDADQASFKLAVETLDGRVDRLQRELETVAVNTASGFQQARQNLARLISYSPPSPRGPGGIPLPEGSQPPTPQ